MEGAEIPLKRSTWILIFKIAYFADEGTTPEEKKERINFKCTEDFLNLCSDKVNSLFQVLNYISTLESSLWGAIRCFTTPFPNYISHTYTD